MTLRPRSAPTEDPLGYLRYPEVTSGTSGALRWGRGEALLQADAFRVAYPRAHIRGSSPRIPPMAGVSAFEAALL